MARPVPPHELTFVLDVPSTGMSVIEQAERDMYQPDGVDGPLPAVIIVTGTSPAAYPIRPRQWPVYQGYGRLAASRGVLGVVLDVRYHDMTEAPTVAAELPGLVESVRALDIVDENRIAVWAFSAGAMLVGHWFEESPEWLRCLALTYPVLSGLPPVRPGRPLVVTRVGQERPEWLAEVDKLVASGAVHVIDVPDGQHGFDGLDHTEQSRSAVTEAADYVVGQLTAPTRS